MDTIIEIETQSRTITTSSPLELVENLTSIIGFQPNNESIVIINTETISNKVISCKIISTLDMFNILEHINNEDSNVGTILCYYTKQPLDRVRPSAERLFDYLNGLINVRDILFIRHNRWGSFICFDDLCCPPNGRIF